ncbi:tumor necrosis factor ligand superfamily member 15-like isoform X2 [Hemiscyllium ocellatum]|uniref:tumor necrosis factor ligand superfamily member 15-like isoform X2 n=1 Tax=Hemiscyllium ocellatum TaxID=170820 RepID=UPI002966A2A0|nr:tumor necrosis factor ligand superfamily member 15-like isoform X2 [Hemiscyllium ocellatum]
MPLKGSTEISLLSYSVSVTALFICSNIALALYVRRFGFQCLNCQPRSRNTSHGLRGWNVSDEEQFQALDWAFETGVAYSNMAYADGHLWIPQSGLYYVYSQVAFYLPSCQELRGRGARAAATVLTHNVYKRADSYPEPTVLLTATKSVCEGGTGDWHVTISQGAMFALRERDSLFVTVNKVAMVVHVEQKTFFGAFML